MCSIVLFNVFAIRYATFNEGSVSPLSMFDNIERESFAFLARSSCVMLNFFLASIKFGRGFSSFILANLLAHLVNFIFVLYAHSLSKSIFFCLFYERLFYEHFILKYIQKVSVMKMFKERLKKLRIGMGLTQEQLADKLELPPSTIRRYESMEKGYPKEERLQAIADFFKCTVDYLLGRETKEPSIEETQEEKEQKEILRLVIGITDPVIKRAAIEVLKGLAGEK